MRPLLTCLAAVALTLGASVAWADTPQHVSDFGGLAHATAAPTTLEWQDSPARPDLGPTQDSAEAASEEAPAAAEPATAEAEAYEAASEDPIEGAILDSVFRTNNLWIVIAAFLVFIMHLGFSCLETGLTQAKNSVNILFKNVFIISIGIVTYAICGFNLMYPGDSWLIPGVLGFAGFGIEGASADNTRGYDEGFGYHADFIFQAMFAATAATIISGCVAERIKLAPFLVLATIFVAIVYPILGSWHWGEGWLYQMDFYDFAGSTLVHSVGGWAGLAVILVLGARKGKYVDGQVRPILPSNLPLATIGVFLLWFGWFGFNGGSELSADPGGVAYAVTTTAIAAALGGIAGGLTSWIVGGKPDLTMALNGVLAGLVGITAAPDTTLLLTVIVGVLCGVVVYFSVIALDNLRIDDPVGAVSVHLVCGIIGTIFAAFSPGAEEGASVITQLIGILAYGAVAFPAALILALVIKATLGLRVSDEMETEGLDSTEHGMGAYHGVSVQ
ncbi:MAG: ammonium transporter [Planctomycetota bacterium]|nr:MAG: ammonium transporter [Planctomycetota bacterium]